MKMINTKTGIVILLILAAALSRLFTVMPNFTPIGAIALFAAAYFSSRAVSYIIPFVAIYLSSLVLNNVVYSSDEFIWMGANFPFQVAGFSLIVLMGSRTLRKVNVASILGSAFAGAVVFFLVTNFGSWIIDYGNIYPNNFSGLMAAYAAGIPFFKNTLMGDLCYSTILFGSYALLKARLPQLATS